MREPNIYDVVLRAREKKIAFCVEFDLCQGPFMSCRKRKKKTELNQAILGVEGGRTL